MSQTVQYALRIDPTSNRDIVRLNTLLTREAKVVSTHAASDGSAIFVIEATGALARKLRKASDRSFEREIHPDDAVQDPGLGELLIGLRGWVQRLRRRRGATDQPMPEAPAEGSGPDLRDR